MEEITPAEIEKLLEIISPAPLLRIGHFSDHGITIMQCLDNLCKTQGYEYLLNCTSRAYMQSIQVLPHSDACTIRYFSLDRSSYMQHGKFYDYLFVSAKIAADARESFLKKSHRVIKNAGLILLFVPREDRDASLAWQALLEKHYYVATSTIDLDAKWQVIVSKKMHGWGG